MSDRADHFTWKEGDLEVVKGNKSKLKKSLREIHKNLAGVPDPLIVNGVTTVDDDHSHPYQRDNDGKGTTTGQIGTHGIPHIHSITNFNVATAQGHIHELI